MDVWSFIDQRRIKTNNSAQTKSQLFINKLYGNNQVATNKDTFEFIVLQMNDD